MNRLKQELRKHHIIGCTDEMSILKYGYDESENLVCFTNTVIVTRYDSNVIDSEYRLYDRNYNLIAIQSCYPETQFFGDAGNKWQVYTNFD